VHHSDYGVFRPPLSAFVARAREHGWGGRIEVVAPGDTVPLVDPTG
jgi:hypothetical protein